VTNKEGVHTCNNCLPILYIVLEESTPTQETSCPEKPQQMQTSNQLHEKEDISSPPQAASVHVEYKAQPQGQQLPPAPKLPPSTFE